MQADKILKTLRLTEKSNAQSAEFGQYTFEVYPTANKASIAPTYHGNATAPRALSK